MIDSAVTAKPRVLLVEDDERLDSLVREYLSQNEFSVRVAGSGDEALETFSTQPADLVILDLMLPGMDGLQVCKTLRKTFTGPIMMLTAKGSDIDQVVGLELGADDYVVKPVEPRLLLARVRALLRRFDQEATDGADSALDFGRLHINPAALQVTLSGQPITLTTQEFEL